MLFFDEIADWWDEQRRESEEALSDFVTGSGSWWRIVLATVVHTSMTLGSGLVDLLRLGEGVKKGGWRGLAEDGLRLLTLAGPIARGARGVARFLVPNSFPGHGICGWITATQVLRQTGVKHFALLEDLVRASGRSEIDSLYLHEIEALLKQLGARTTYLSTVQSVKEIAALLARNPRSVVVFGAQYVHNGVQGGHALYAFRDILGRIRFVDRTGKVLKSLEELEKIYKSSPGIGTATPVHAVVVQNARVAQLITGGATIALEVRPAIDATREQIDEAMDAARAKHGLPPSKHRLSPKSAPNVPGKGSTATGPARKAAPASHQTKPAGGGASNTNGRTHTVKPGDTWMSIASRYTTPTGVPASILAGLLKEQSVAAGYTQHWEGPKVGTVLSIPN